LPELKLNVTPDQHEAFKRSSASLGLSLAAWVRSTLVQAAQKGAPKQSAAERKLLEREATRQANAAARESEDMQRVLAYALEYWPSVERYLAQAMASGNSGAIESAEKFKAWCLEHGHIKGE